MNKQIIAVLNDRGIVATMLALVPTEDVRLMSVEEMLDIVDKIASIRHAQPSKLVDRLCDALYHILVFHKMYNTGDSTMFFWRMTHINADINIQYAYAISNLLNYRIEESHRVRNVVDKLVTVANILQIDLSVEFTKYVRRNN